MRELTRLAASIGFVVPFLCALCAPRASAQEFGPPAVLSDSDPNTDVGADLDPQVATDGSGNWIAVWTSKVTEAYGDGEDIYVSRSSDDGATWTPLVALNTNAATDSGNDNAPAIATDGKANWVVVWRSTESQGAVDRGHSASVSHQTTVLELLRAGDRDALELRLGTGRRWSLATCASTADPRAHATVQPSIEGDLQGRGAAATTVITQARKDPIYELYQRLIDSGTKPNLARVSLARAIAAIVLRMWKDQEVYKPGYYGTQDVTARDA